MKEYAYFPGCALQGSGVEYDLSTSAVCRALGIQLREIPDWNCCGASPVHNVDHLLATTLPARNLSIAEKMGLDIAAPCPACSLRLITTNKELKSDASLREEVNRVLDEPYNCGIEVRSLLQTLYEDIGPEKIRSLVKRPLTGLKVVTYYGCLLTRPPKVVRFDDPENPTSMDELLQACGIEVVDFPLKTECCGAAYGLPKKEMLLRLSGKILEVASRSSADAIVVPCPLCHQNLDLRQGQINAKHKTNFNIPIYYFTEILGIALGFSIKEVGIDRHAVDGTKLIASGETF